MTSQLLFKILFTVILFCFTVNNALYGQISHGGMPRFHASSLLKSSTDNNFFIEMPAFDIESLLEEDKLDESDIQRSFRFAHKFYVDIEKGKSGKNFTLPDGTKIWQVGIRSKGAYSINVFFSEYNIPEGARLFLYNSDKTHIIGAFTHENNSEDNILPIQPVAGEEIIIEYEEPANAAFEGQLKISEVNHDYKDLLKYDFKIDPPSNVDITCMPDILCQDPDNDNARSTVLVIINGITSCSGSLLNTTNNDGEPVLLTAVHCLNGLNFSAPNDNYVKAAGTIVSFFNYRKPVCSLRMMATQEMSLAGAIPLSIAIKNDMALLRFKDTPPDYYKPYYAGWNVNPSAGNNNPFVNIHHPQGLVAKYGSAETTLSIKDFEVQIFNPQAHWEVSSWTEGATAGGSSGSPLFDNQGLVIGGLSGGHSLCSNGFPNSKADYFFALYKSWEYPANIGNTLKSCLDPLNSGVLQNESYDPYRENPLVRLKNTDYNGTDVIANSTLNSPELGLVFGHNSLQTTEFAEEFNTDKCAEIVGAYFIIPPTRNTTPVKINVYKESLSEENLIASEIFRPVYWNYTSSAFEEKDRVTTYPIETFVKFSDEAQVGKKFYVSYEITYPSTRDFSVYNVTSESPRGNTAWLCEVDGNWIPATKHPYAPMSTSLTIEPLIRYITGTCPNGISTQKKKDSGIVYSSESRQLRVNTDNPNETGVIIVYSLTGQLLCEISYLGNNPVSLQSIPQRNIVIVKALSKDGVKTGKIVL